MEQFLSYLTVLLDVIKPSLTPSPHSTPGVSDKISTVDGINSMSFLHTMDSNDPSPRVHESVVDMCPRIFGRSTCVRSKTASAVRPSNLHVVAGVRANVDLVKRLCRACPKACKVQDDDGRSPLHMLCDAECSLSSRRSASLLVLLAPVSMDGLDEMSPLEYAM